MLVLLFHVIGKNLFPVSKFVVKRKKSIRSIFNGRKEISRPGGVSHLWDKVKSYLNNRFGTGTYNNDGSILMVESQDTTDRPAVNMLTQSGFAFFTRTGASTDYDFYLDNNTGNDIEVYMFNLATVKCDTVNIKAGNYYRKIVFSSGNTTQAYIIAWTSKNTI